jgi:hypothetical protein
VPTPRSQQRADRFVARTGFGVNEMPDRDPMRDGRWSG